MFCGSPQRVSGKAGVCSISVPFFFVCVCGVTWFYSLKKLLAWDFSGFVGELE